MGAPVLHQRVLNQRILLGVSGGIAAYKACELTRRLRDAGAEVRVVLTANAARFVSPLTFQALSGQSVRSDLWDEAAEMGMGHLELARRALGEELQQLPALTTPRESAAYLRAKLAHLPYEVFACLYLDNRHRVLGFAELFRGTTDGASVHPREVVRECIARNAAAVILAHNHPSGVAEPSAADRAITRELRDALALVGVRVLDHFVIGAGEPTSMAARGMI